MAKDLASFYEETSGNGFSQSELTILERFEALLHNTVSLIPKMSGLPDGFANRIERLSADIGVLNSFPAVTDASDPAVKQWKRAVRTVAGFISDMDDEVFRTAFFRLSTDPTNTVMGEDGAALFDFLELMQSRLDLEIDDATLRESFEEARQWRNELPDQKSAETALFDFLECIHMQFDMESKENPFKETLHDVREKIEKTVFKTAEQLVQSEVSDRSEPNVQTAAKPMESYRTTPKESKALLLIAAEHSGYVKELVIKSLATFQINDAEKHLHSLIKAERAYIRFAKSPMDEGYDESTEPELLLEIERSAKAFLQTKEPIPEELRSLSNLGLSDLVFGVREHQYEIAEKILDFVQRRQTDLNRMGIAVAKNEQVQVPILDKADVAADVQSKESPSEMREAAVIASSGDGKLAENRKRFEEIIAELVDIDPIASRAAMDGFDALTAWVQGQSDMKEDALQQAILDIAFISELIVGAHKYLLEQELPNGDFAPWYADVTKNIAERHYFDLLLLGGIQKQAVHDILSDEVGYKLLADPYDVCMVDWLIERNLQRLKSDVNESTGNERLFAEKAEKAYITLQKYARQSEPFDEQTTIDAKRAVTMLAVYSMFQFSHPFVRKLPAALDRTFVNRFTVKIVDEMIRLEIIPEELTAEILQDYLADADAPRKYMDLTVPPESI